MACDAATLLDEASCLECGLSEQQLLAVMVFLLCQISAGGGGVTTTQVSKGNGAPVAAPSSPTLANIYYDEDAGSPSYGNTWVWDSNLLVWI